MHDFPNNGNIPGNMTSSNLHCVPIEMTIHNAYENKLGESIEDCRDFLRTGRCKYGASCKFYHPSNVESGGGMKIPIDPSEPMFPIRPNEPVCQYYMKHGTCKFGQACKFHHPPLNTIQQTPSILASTSVFIPRTCEQRIVLNSLGQDQGISAMMVQFLPQRPDEPDCTYYLRNGTCKYGATCRYHHPVSYHQQGKIESQRRPQAKIMQVQNQLPSEGVMQFVQTQAVYQHQNNRVISSPGVQHVLVTETPLKVMSLSNGSVQSGASDDVGPLPVNIPIGMSQHHASSSSIASSFETASCGLEFIPESWDKSKRSNSSGSFSMYVDAQQARQGSANRLLGSTNDMSMQNRRLRAASFGSLGSTSENSGYYDGYLGWPSGSGVHGLRANHESSYEAGQPIDQSFRQSSYGIRDDLQQRRAHQDQRNTIAYHVLPHQNRVNNVDQGLSMMTSALLNMLDTPEDAAARSYPQCDPSTNKDPLSPNASIGNRNSHSQYFSSTSTNQGYNQESMSKSDRVLLQGNSGSYTLSSHSHRYRDIPPAIDTINGPSAQAKYQGTTEDFVYDTTRYRDNDYSPVSRDWSIDWQEREGQQMRPNLQANSVPQHRKPNERSNHVPHLGANLPYFP